MRSRSAVEVLLGDVWKPRRILQQVLPRPKPGKYGWTPSSSRYTDRLAVGPFMIDMPGTQVLFFRYSGLKGY